jgi:hypothetical protein
MAAAPGSLVCLLILLNILEISMVSGEVNINTRMSTDFRWKLLRAGNTRISRYISFSDVFTNCLNSIGL